MIGRESALPLRLWGPHASIGLAIVAVTFLIDQLTKTWLIWGYRIAERGRVEVTPFLDLVMAWNLGVSYGLFPLEGTGGQLGLAAFKAGVSIFLWLWLCRTRDWLTSWGLALIIGGALGNAVDRIVYGGVADFFSLHLRGIGSNFHWYVFNVADVAIVAGVGVLLYESLLRKRPPEEAEGRKE